MLSVTSPKPSDCCRNRVTVCHQSREEWLFHFGMVYCHDLSKGCLWLAEYWLQGFGCAVFVARCQQLGLRMETQLEDIRSRVDNVVVRDVGYHTVG